MDILAKKFYAKFTEIQENGANRVFGDSPIMPRLKAILNKQRQPI